MLWDPWDKEWLERMWNERRTIGGQMQYTFVEKPRDPNAEYVDVSMPPDDHDYWPPPPPETLRRIPLEEEALTERKRCYYCHNEAIKIRHQVPTCFEHSSSQR